MKEKICMLLMLLTLSCSSDQPLPINEPGKVTITLKNNDVAAAETLAMYENQDAPIIAINECKGSPTIGDKKTCSSGTRAFDVGFSTDTALQSETLPDSVAINELDPGFYWALFFIYRGN